MANTDGRKTRWAKNFGRSVKYSGVDILSDLTPNTTDTYAGIRDGIAGIAKEIREMRSGNGMLNNAINGAPIIKYGSQAVQNAVKDLKSGRINNRARVEKMADADLDSLSGDFNFDDEDGTSFDFEPVASSDNGKVSSGSSGSSYNPIAAIQPGIDSTARNTASTAIAANQINMSVTKQSNLIHAEFDRANKVSTQIATTNIAFLKQMHGESQSTLQNVNANLAKIIDFNNDTISKGVMAQLKYYDDSLAVMNDMLAELKLANTYAPKPQEQEEQEKSQYSQMFNSRGVMKFSNYPKILKDNFNRVASEDPILGTVKEFLTNEDALKMLAANPLGNMSTFIASGLIPTIMKTTLKEFDKSVGAFFPALFAKIGNYQNSDNPLVSMLAKVFGIHSEASTRPSLANYEKGAVPWDGVSRRTLNVVIPKYLAGILAAVSGKEEEVHDYETGEWTTRRAMAQKMEDERMNRMLSPFTKQMNMMQKMFTESIDASEKQRHDFDKSLKEFITYQVENGQMYNPRRDDISKFVSSPEMGKVVAALFKAMPRNMQMAMGGNIFRGRADLDELMNKIDDMTNLKWSSVYSGQGNSGIEFYGDKGKYRVKRGSLMGGTIDEYGKTQTDLLRDIKEILYEGITTYPVTYNVNGKKRHGNIRVHPAMEGRHRAYKDKKSAARAARDQEDSEEDYDTSVNHEEGRISIRDLSALGAGGATSFLQANYNNKHANAKDSKAGGFYDYIDRNITGDNTVLGTIKNKLAKFLKAPMDLFVNAINKIDEGMYTIIYGPEGDEDKSIVGAAIKGIQNTFNNFTGWLKKKWNATSKWMFGEEGIKGTKAYKFAKEQANRAMDYLFGQKNENGARKGGVLSSSFNALSDMFYEVRSSMFGTKYVDSQGKAHGFNKHSIFNQVKISFLKGARSMRNYLFGEPEKNADGSKKSFLDSITDKLGEGFTNFKNFFFGAKTSKEDGQAQFKAFMTETKKNMPKSLAMGAVGAGLGLFTNFGLLGTLFLPGGPIGGAILGLGTGIVSQSEGFKKWLFGAKGTDGKRMGGVVSKSTMDWLRRNKDAIVGGAGFGILKHFVLGNMLSNLGPLGYMASMFMPGGIVGSAIMGSAMGIAIKSNTFQSFLYGKKGADGKRTGGILNKQYSQALKKHLPNMAFGALSFGAAGAVIGQMGIMGAMLTPGGPIGAAVLGAATGIAISSKRFKTWLFGKDDKNGVHEAGVYDKAKNMLSINFQRLGLKLKKMSFNVKWWFKEEIGNRFADAIAPMKAQFKIMVGDIKDMFAKAWSSVSDFFGNTFTKYVGVPLGKFMEERVLKPMRSFMSKLIGGIGRIFGKILSSPFKALSYMTVGLRNYQEGRAHRENRRESLSNLKNSIKNAITGNSKPGDRSVWANMKDAFKEVVYTKDAQEKARNKYYNRDAEDERIKKRNEEQAGEKARELAALQAEEERLNNVGDAAAAVNYNTSMKDTNGNNVPIEDLYKQNSDNAQLIATTINDSLNPSSFLGKVNKGILNAIVSIGARLTGNPDFLNHFNPNLRAGDKVADVLGFNPDEYRRLKAAKGFEDPVKAKAEHDKAKRAEQAGMSASEKDAIAGTVADNQPSDDGDGTSKSKKHRTIANARKLLGTGKKKSVVAPNAPTPTETPGSVAQSNFGGFTMDLQLFGNGKSSGVQNAMSGNMKSDKSTAAQKAVANAEAKKSKKAEGFSNSATKYLRIIASAVDGQLDGVGSNIYKIRKAVESLTGFDSGDLGSGNKDRTTLMGRARRMAKMLVMHPIEFLGDIVSAPFKLIGTVTEKAFNTMNAIVSGVGSMITGATKGIMAIGRQVLDTALAIPKLGLKVIQGAAEVTTEVLVGGAKVATTALIGGLNSTFKIINGLASATGHLISGIGNAAGSLVEGVGAMAKEGMISIGKGIGAIASIAADGAKAVGDVVGSVAKATGAIVASSVETVGKMANTILSGFTDLLTSTAGLLFNVVSSPFKFLSNMGKGIMPRGPQTVRVIGGSLDAVKTVDTVKVVEVIKGGTIDETRSVAKVGEVSGSVTIVGMNDLINAVMTSRGGNGKKFRAKLAAGGFKAPKFDLQAFAEGKEEAGAPANVTAMDIKAGAKAGEHVQRTAAYMQSVKETVAEKDFLHDNEASQTTHLESIDETTKKHSNAFAKFFKWLAASLPLLFALLKKLPSALANKLLGGNTAGAIAKEIKQVFKDIAEDAKKTLKKKWGSMLQKLIGSKKGQMIARGAQQLKNSAAAKWISKKAPYMFGDMTAEDAVKYHANGDRMPVSNKERLEQFGSVAREQAPEAGEKKLWKQMYKEDAAAFKVARGANVGGGFSAQFNAPVVEETPGAISAVEGGAGGLGNANPAQAVEEEGAGLAAKVKKMFTEGLKKLEAMASKHAGKALSFADGFAAKFLPKLTTNVIVQHAASFTKAIGTTVAGAGSLGIVDGVLATWNSVTGLVEAAHIFRVKSDAVTPTMRIVAGIVKAIWGCTPLAIVSCVLSILGMLFGFDHVGMTATTIYKFLVDSGSAEALDEAQAAFEKEAKEAGMSVEDYNDQENKTVWDKMMDGWSSFKDGVANNAKYVWNGIKNNAEYVANGIANNAQYVKNGIDNNLAWLFGQNDAEGHYQNGVFANMKDGLDNNLAYLFGQNDSEGNYQKGAIATLGDKISDGIDNNLAYIFGSKNEDGSITPSPMFANMRKTVTEGFSKALTWFLGYDYKDGYQETLMGKMNDWIDNQLAYLFGQNDENGNYQKGVFAKAKDEVDAVITYWAGGEYTNGESDEGRLPTLGRMISESFQEAWGPIIDDIKSRKDWVVDKWNNTLAWMFGQNDENGNYQNGVFANLKDSIDNNLAWLFGQNDENGNYQNGVFANWKKSFDGVLASIFGESDYTTVDEDGNVVPVEGGKGFVSTLVEKVQAMGGEFVDWAKTSIKNKFNAAMEAVLGTPEKRTKLGTLVDKLGEWVSRVGKELNRVWSDVKTKAWRTMMWPFAKFRVWVSDGEMSEDDKLILGSSGSSYDVGDTSQDSIGAPSEGNPFAGSGKGDKRKKFHGFGTNYSQNDPRWKNNSYGDIPGMGNMGDSGCGPTVMASILSDMGANVDPTDMANLALADGTRVPGGTSEDFFSDAASRFGLGARHLNGVGDIVDSVMSGQQVVVGGTSAGDGPGNTFTRAGHYSRVVGIDGDNAIMADPRGDAYSGTVPLSTLANQVQTGYAFGGVGDKFKGAGPEDGDAVAAGGSEGGVIGKYFIKGIKWLFGMDGQGGIFSTAFDMFNNGVNSIYNTIFGGNGADGEYQPGMFESGGLMMNVINKGIDFVFGADNGDGTRTGGVISTLYNKFNDGITTATNWVFGAIPGGNLIKDTVTAGVNYIFGTPDSNGNRTGGLFSTMKDDLAKGWEDVKGWIFGNSGGLSKSSILDKFSEGISNAAKKLKGGGEGDNMSRIQRYLSQNPLISAFTGAGTPKQQVAAMDVFRGAGSTTKSPRKEAMKRAAFTASGPGPVANRQNPHKKHVDHFAGSGPADKSNISGDDIIETGKQQLGIPYVLGGDGESSTDCGMFTQHTLNKCGLDMSTRLADAQFEVFASAGAAIPLSEATAGDLVFFENTYGSWPAGTITHVGFYAGDNQMLHAGCSKGVSFADLSSDYYQSKIHGQAGSVSKLYGITPGTGKGGTALNGKGGKGGKKKERTIMDLFSHAGKMYGNFATSVMGNKVYTGTSWDDTDDSSGGNSGGSGGANGISADGESIAKWLHEKGYSNAAAGGILGRFQQEHGFSPTDVPLHDVPGVGECGGLGIAQWTHGRADAMKAYAANHGQDYQTVDAQLNYMWEEDIPAQKAYGDFYPSGMNQFSDPVEANAYWTKGFERGVPSSNDATYSTNWYNYMQSHFSGSGKGDKFLGSGFDPLGVLNNRIKVWEFGIKHGASPQSIASEGGYERTKKAMDKYNKGPAPGKIRIPAYLAEQMKYMTPEQRRNFIIAYKKGAFGKFASEAALAKSQQSSGDVMEDVAPNGKHYEANDVDYLMKKGYTYKDAIAFLAKDPKYSGKGDATHGPNGRAYEKNDIDYLMKKGYTKEDAIAFLATDPKYKDPIKANDKATASTAKASTDGKTAPAEQPKRRRKHRGFAGWIEGMFGGLFGHHSDKKDSPVAENQTSAPASSSPGLVDPRNAGSFADLSSFKGGEYFNAPQYITEAAKKYVRGEGTLEDVAKSIGFDGVPDGSTTLTAEQQRALGFREYAVSRNWNHYLNEAVLWKRDGMTSAERWAKFHGSGKGKFKGNGLGDVMAFGRKNGIFAALAGAWLQNQRYKTMQKAQVEGLGLFGTSPGPVDSKGKVVAPEVAPNGKHYEENDIKYLISKGYARKDAIAFLATDPKYAKNGGKDSNEYGPNGRKYEENDIKYLMSKGYTRGDAIAFLATDPKYKDKANAVASTPAVAAPAEQPKRRRKHRGFAGWIEGMFDGLFGHHSKKKETPVAENQTSHSSSPGLVDPKNAGSFADLSSFKGGEYFNAPQYITEAAKNYIKGDGKLIDVAKSIGFDSIPDGTTPLTAEQQRALGFREYAVARNWNNYLNEAVLWKRDGMTSAERWSKFHGSGIGDMDEGRARREPGYREPKRRRRFKGSGLGDIMAFGRKNGIFAALAGAWLQNKRQKAMMKAHEASLGLFGNSPAPEVKAAGKVVVPEVAPNGKHYEANDVNYLTGKGYTREDAIAFLAKDPKYNGKSAVADSNTKVDPKLKKAVEDAKTKAQAPEVAPNGKHYEENDIAYLIKQGYTRESAIAFLAKDPKYATIGTKNTTPVSKAEVAQVSGNATELVRNYTRSVNGTSDSNSKNSSDKILAQILEALETIAKNTGNTASGIGSLGSALAKSAKARGQGGAGGTRVISIGGGPQGLSSSFGGNGGMGKDYEMNRKIARGGEFAK